MFKLILLIALSQSVLKGPTKLVGPSNLPISSSGGGGTVTLINTTTCTNIASASPCSVSAGAGHGLFVLIQIPAAGATVTSVADSASDTGTAVTGAAFSCAGSIQTSGFVYYIPNTGGSISTVTATTSGNWSAVVYEASGTNSSTPLDQSGAVGTDTVGVPVTPSLVISASASELIIGSAGVGTGAGTTMTPAGWTNDFTQFSDGWGHNVISSTGTYAGSWTTSQHYCSGAASFKP